MFSEFNTIFGWNYFRRRLTMLTYGLVIIWTRIHNMTWKVLFHDEFAEEFKQLSTNVQNELLAYVKLLQVTGHQLRRPHADTLKGSQHANMKEIRFTVNNGVWRVAYAFDPLRQAIILVAGDKTGDRQKRFYKQLIAKADQRFNAHLKQLKEKGE